MCESVRWVESYEHIARHARELESTRLVCVGDRESDMLELMVKARVAIRQTIWCAASTTGCCRDKAASCGRK